MEIQIKVKKWGNSLAVILPKSLVDTKNIKENDELVIEVQKRRPLVKDLFGLAKGLKKRPTQEIKDEMREGWLSDSDREREERWNNQS